jgi:nicotinamidase-related amidase
MTELHNLWPDSNRAVLVVVDIQERLILSMPEEPLKRTIKSSTILINGCKVLNIPILATEQYSKGLGPTISEVKDALGDLNPIEKMTFSCYEEPSFRRALETLGERAVDIILCGIESHVCVLQTVLDLLEDELEELEELELE